MGLLQVYSLNVKLHFVHRKNWVDDSSLPRVCTCHTKAKLFPHFGHSILTVGKVLNFCSFLPMTAIDSWNGLSSFIGEGTITFPWVSVFFFKPHFGQINTKFFPCFFGTSLFPQFSQNSIVYSTYLFLSPHS
jgi:hypothetical protein